MSLVKAAIIGVFGAALTSIASTQLHNSWSNPVRSWFLQAASRDASRIICPVSGVQRAAKHYDNPAMNDDAGAPSSLPRPRLPWLPEHLLQRPENSTAENDASESQQGQKKYARRISLLDDLIRDVDMVINSQIVLLCYLDCSLGLFLLRILPQSIFASGSRMALLIPNITTRLYLVCIMSTNIICAFLHLVLDAPSGSELSRGYVHGGFLIDFVGEAAPASKWRMLFFDICIFFLQLLHIGAILEQREAKLSQGDPVLLTLLNQLTGRAESQDMDAEEQGIRRSQEGAQYGVDDDDDDGNTNDPLASEKQLNDESYDGRIVIMAFNPVHLFTKAWQRHLDASGQRTRTWQRHRVEA